MRRTTLFTPEVVDMIRREVAGGVSLESIARQVGCTVGTLRVRCSEKGIHLRRDRAWVPISLTTYIEEKLKAAAALKGVTVAQLAAALIACCVADDIVDAVLDGFIFECASEPAPTIVPIEGPAS